MSRADLDFVVCKNPECRAEVSPFVTECPYCGTRLRKRAPKLPPLGVGPSRVRRLPAPGLGRLRPNEIPGIRGDSKPYATAALVIATCGVWIAWRAGAFFSFDAIVFGPLHGDWWRPLTSQFVYTSGLYQFITLFAIALFGWLLERRYGPFVVVGLFVLAGAGGALLEAVLASAPLASGANGAALGLLAAWAVPDLIARRRGEDYDGDLLGVVVIAAVLLLMPLARTEASPIAGFAGGLIGLAVGGALTRLAPR